MSSPLAGATCVRISDGTVWIRIDSEQRAVFPFSDVFALLLVHEPFYIDPTEATGATWPEPVSGPLDTELRALISQSLASSSDPAAHAKRQLLEKYEVEAIIAMEGGDKPYLPASTIARRFVRAVGYRDIVGFPVPAGLSLDDNGTYLPRQWWTDDEERCLHLEELSRAYEAAHARGESLSATLVVQATDERWIQHLRAGMQWDSYVFDDAAQRFPA